MTASGQPTNTVRAILICGLVGAFLIDFYLVVTMVWIFHTATVRSLFFWDASNLLGRDAFLGGLPTEILGCFLHLIVSMVWGAVFVLVLAPAPAVARHPFVSGIVAGVGVKFIMQYGVIPMGHAQGPQYNWVSLTNNLVAHTLFFGVPVLWIALRLARGTPLQRR